MPKHAQPIIREWVIRAEPKVLSDLLDELVRTAGTVRSNIAPRYRFDERWQELLSCLELDGYRVEDGRIVVIEPMIAGATIVSDDLAVALSACGLPEADEIERMVNSSIENYVRVNPDYNACLNSARVALQTLATSIADRISGASPGSYDRSKWGQVIAFLKTRGLIGPAEEAGLTGVFSLISPGSHRPIGLTEREFARLGRSLAITMTFSLVRRFNGVQGAGE